MLILLLFFDSTSLGENGAFKLTVKQIAGAEQQFIRTEEILRMVHIVVANAYIVPIIRLIGGNI